MIDELQSPGSILDQVMSRCADGKYPEKYIWEEQFTRCGVASAPTLPQVKVYLDIWINNSTRKEAA